MQFLLYLCSEIVCGAIRSLIGKEELSSKQEENTRQRQEGAGGGRCLGQGMMLRAEEETSRIDHYSSKGTKANK